MPPGFLPRLVYLIRIVVAVPAFLTCAPFLNPQDPPQRIGRRWQFDWCTSGEFTIQVGQEQMRCLGEATRRAVEKSGRRALLLASNSLSHRHFTVEPPIPEDMSHERIYHHGQYLWDMHVLDLLVMVPVRMQQVALDQLVLIREDYRRFAVPSDPVLLAKHDHPVGHFLDNIEIVRGRDDCFPLASELTVEIEEAADAARVQALRRLVHQPDLGPRRFSQPAQYS